MNLEFASIWYALGWEEFAPVTELGSRPLTIQFLCSLTETPDGIEFRLFGTDYRLSWKDLSRLLGFSPRCAVSLKRACEGYVRESFWADISGLVYSGKFVPRCNDIVHPTLRLWHKWLTITLFPREDVRPVRSDEMMLLYTAVNLIKVSPVKAMIRQWMTNFKMIGPIECTALVTRIALRLGVLSGNPVPFIGTPRVLIDEAYLIQGHTQEGPK